MDLRQKYEIPDFDIVPDNRLVKGMLILCATPFMYSVFNGYLPPFMKYIWVIAALLLSAMLFLLGRLSARIAAGGTRVPYDPEKSLREYLVLKKSWLSFLCALAVGAAFFGLAHVLRVWYVADYHDGSTALAVGYVYETVAGLYGALVTYLFGLLWFLHDGLYLQPDNSTAFHWIAMVGIVLIPMVYGGVHILIGLFYDLLFAVLLLIRIGRVRSYNRMVARMEREAIDAERRAKSRFE